MTDRPRLILASADPDERADLRAFLAGAPVECVDPEPAPDSPAGGDYAARATHRARACAEAGGAMAIALAFPGDANVAVSTSIIECEIPMAPRGEGGYGLDAVTQILNGKTLAELDAEERSRLGHRGKAVRPLLKRLG